MLRKRNQGALAIALAIATLSLPSAAGAAPGDLDPSFGSGGKLTTDFGGDDEATVIALQPNGKIVAGGENDPPGPQMDDFALARYLPDGALDPIFGGDGTVTTDFGKFDTVHGLAIQPNGRIVAAGSTSAPQVGEFALARYKRDGGLDTTFDEDGKVTTDFGGVDVALDLVIQVDGKIVAVGGAGGNFALARYNEDGSLDMSFGVGGKVTTDFGGSGDAALGVAMQSDGRIVAAGREFVLAGAADFALARYTADGSLDTTFDGDGKVLVDFGGGTDFASDLVIQSDGTILAVGASDPPSTASSDFALARFNPDGSLHTSGLDPYLDAPFGTGGKVTTDFAGAADEASATALEPGGKILVVGSSGEVPDFAFAMARYNVDGSLDSTFGAAGRVTTDFSGENDRARDVAIQGDGAILVAGGAAIASAAADFGLARYLAAPCCVVPVPPGAGATMGSGRYAQR